MLIYGLRWQPPWISDQHNFFLKDLQMIIPRLFGFNYPSGFREAF